MSEEDDQYIAGHVAPPGRYHRVGGRADQIVELDRAGVLPASLDGHVAVYRRLGTTQVAIPAGPTGSPLAKRRARRDG